MAAGTPGMLRGAAVCRASWRLVDLLLGSGDEGIWLAEPEALVTVGWCTALSDSELRAALALPFAGVTPLLAVGSVDGQPRQVVVEARPRGAPSRFAASAAAA